MTEQAIRKARVMSWSGNDGQDAHRGSVPQTWGMDWREVSRITAGEVQARRAAGEEVDIVDVRRPTARRSGYIVGDVLHPRRTHGEDPPLSRDRTLVLY